MMDLQETKEIIIMFYPVLVTIFGIFFCYVLTIIFLLNSGTRWAMILYLIWLYWDRETPNRGGRPSILAIHSKFNKFAINYCQIKLLKQASFELDPIKNYFLCVFPHGVLSAALLFAFEKNEMYSEVFPHHEPRRVTTSFACRTPFLREYFLSIGFITANKRSIKYCLNHPGGGRLVAMCAGGAREVLHSKPHDYTLVLKNRKGFVKVALETGMPLVPVFSFNETSLYKQKQIAKNTFTEFVRHILGFAPILMWGRALLAPFKVPITVLVGEPIEVVKNENPSQEEIDALHSLFISKLTRLFEDNKHKYIENADNIFLNII